MKKSSKKQLQKPLRNKRSAFVVICLVLALAASGLAIYNNQQDSKPATKESITAGQGTSTSAPDFGLYIDPDKATYNLGEPFTVQIYANLASTPVRSISAYLHYDPAKLRLDSATQGDASTSYVLSTRCTSLDGCKKAGEALFLMAQAGDLRIAPQNKLLIGSMTFTPLTAGPAYLKFDSKTDLSGFENPQIDQKVLNTRSLQHGVYNIVKR